MLCSFDISAMMAQSANSSMFLVCHRFAVKWTIKMKELKDIGNIQFGIPKIKRSDIFQFKFYNDFKFFLEITQVDTGISRLIRENSEIRSPLYKICIKGSKNWSYSFEYTFFLSEDMAFHLAGGGNLLDLPFISNFYVSDEDDVTIYCLVNASPTYPDSLANESESILKEDQGKVDCESQPKFALPADYKNPMVIDFILKGVIPNFTVETAIRIIREAKDHKCEVLKILSVEFLMQNITKESLKQISRAAIDFDIPRLERKCIKLIADGRIVIK